MANLAKVTIIDDDQARPSTMVWNIKDLAKGTLTLITKQTGNGKANGTAFANFNHSALNEPIMMTGKQLFLISKMSNAVKYANGKIEISNEIKDFAIDSSGVMHIG